MDQKTAILLVIAAIAIVGVGAGIYVLTDDGPNDDQDTTPDVDPEPVKPTEREFAIDALGRQVPIPDNLDNGIVTVGLAGPLRYLTLFDVYDKIIEIDKSDASDKNNGRGFSYAYDYTKKPTHPSPNLSNELVEHLGQLKPSLVIMQQSIWENNTGLGEILAKATPVLVTPAQNMLDFVNYSDFTVCDTYKKSITMVGQVLKMEDRAAEHLQDVQNILDDIRKYVKPNADPGITYVAGLTIHGSNVWNTTFPDYIPLRITSGVNAYSGDTDKEGRAPLNVEDAMNCIMHFDQATGKYTKVCDRIVIDPSSSDKIKEESTQKMMEGIYKINNDGDKTNDIGLYVTYPIVWCYINYDCVLAGSYYLCELMYGTLSHAEVEKKVQNVFDTFYGVHGKNIPHDMGEFFVGKSADAGVELPLISEIEIVYKDGKYATAAV